MKKLLLLSFVYLLFFVLACFTRAAIGETLFAVNPDAFGGTPTIVSINPLSGDQTTVTTWGLMNTPLTMEYTSSDSLLVAGPEGLIEIDPLTGNQSLISSGGIFNAFLRGDLAVNSPVPIPSAAWLFGTGLLGLIGIGRKKVSRPAPGRWTAGPALYTGWGGGVRNIRQPRHIVP